MILQSWHTRWQEHVAKDEVLDKQELMTEALRLKNIDGNLSEIF